ncbi:MAG: dethiobiotin synthase [Deltaproteobacteria bacterium]|nr:dethiobiotin synthase [Deltaproteobacteria bacterium]MCL5276445.1 dethiobiotin synthase [Deltaproteobacteria bacterium]
MRGILITGTDTGVGKTYTALRIINTARAAGLGVAAMKPFETGCGSRDSRLVPRDAVKLMKACGMNDIDTVNPYRFKTPAAPYVAARIEDRGIDVKKVVTLYGRLHRSYDLVVVEGAGGLLVPIERHLSYADLARELSLEVLVVSANRLGAINHTMLTVDCTEAHGLSLLGVVLNSMDKKDDTAKRTNASVLSLLLGKKFLGETGCNSGRSNRALYKKIIGLALQRPAGRPRRDARPF